MSALVGLYFRDGKPVAPDRLDAMLESMEHRGSDSMGTWHRESVGLGQRMLWTTLEALRETLPLVDSRARLCLTADARIDNRAELLALLDFNGRPPSEIADSELILAAYEKWGDECPARLLGDFAFAVWDASRQRLFCARDHFGGRQLYYYSSPQLFACATEIKALLTLPEAPRRLNEARVADYLLSLFEDKTATLYEGVYALPPGHSLIVEATGARAPRPYWSLDPTREIKFKTDAEYADRFLEIFTEAVRCRLRCNNTGALGSALSGGLDSSSITCVARKLLAEEGSSSSGGGGKTLHTFSAVYDEVPECDERRYINTVLAQGGVEAYFGHPDRLSPLTDWENGDCGADEPLWNPQMTLHWALYEAARKQGVRVFLDGFGGDFVVAHGGTRLTELARGGRLLAAVKESNALARRSGYSSRHILWRRVVVPLAPAPLRRAWRTLRRREATSSWLAGIPLRADFARRIGLPERVAALCGERAQPVRSLRQQHWLDLRSGLYPFALGVDDRTTARFGIERRHPFTDKRLVEFCLALPARQKMQNGWTRSVARRALANILPVEIERRMSKTDHSPNFNRGLLTKDRVILEDMIFLVKKGRIAEYVDAGQYLEIYRRYLSRADNSDGFILWRIAALALWLQRAGFAAGGPSGGGRDIIEPGM